MTAAFQHYIRTDRKFAVVLKNTLIIYWTKSVSELSFIELNELLSNNHSGVVYLSLSVDIPLRWITRPLLCQSFGVTYSWFKNVAWLYVTLIPIHMNIYDRYSMNHLSYLLENLLFKIIPIKSEWSLWRCVNTPNPVRCEYTDSSYSVLYDVVRYELNTYRR